MDFNGDSDLIQWEGVEFEMETLAIVESSKPLNYASKCVVVPVVTSSIFMLPKPDNSTELDKSQGYVYGRHGNPTRNHLEAYFAKFEGAKHALAFGSGVAAVGAVVLTLEQGDHILASKSLYGGSFALLKETKRFGISVDFFGTTDCAEIINLIKPNTKMVYFETPSNPDLKIFDISEISKGVHARNPSIQVVVDNTFLTPVFQRCLTLGADVVLYSTSKYIGGHADIIGGIVTTNSDDLYKKIHHSQEIYGGIPSSFDCYLTIRSLKMLPLRMQQHYKNALRVAKFLESHPNVVKVVHPGLKSHPQHQLALKQQRGHSGMIGFYVKGGLQEATNFITSVNVVKNAPSLGADISLVTIPASLSHIQLTKEERNLLGITDNFLRLSVGLEGAQSIIDDLNQALNKAVK